MRNGAVNIIYVLAIVRAPLTAVGDLSSPYTYFDNRYHRNHAGRWAVDSST